MLSVLKLVRLYLSRYVARASLRRYYTTNPPIESHEPAGPVC